MEREQQLRLMALFRADMAVIEPNRNWVDGVPHPSFKRDAAEFRFEQSAYLFKVWCAGRGRAVPVGLLRSLLADLESGMMCNPDQGELSQLRGLIGEKDHGL